LPGTTLGSIGACFVGEAHGELSRAALVDPIVALREE
jgi:hypothetical protein